MERQSKGSRSLEAYCKGGQGLPRAVAPLKKTNTTEITFSVSTTVRYYKQLSEFRSIQEAIQTAITLTLSSDDNLIITRLLN